MREILFRGFSSGEVFYGHLFTEVLPSGALYAAIVKKIDGHYRNVVVDEKTVGQFTGLTDCNGVKIFEGDIVKTYYNGNSYEVKYGECLLFDSEGYENGYFTGLIWDGEPFSTDVYGGVDKYKVIGNIHQNPELLERTHG